MKLEIDFNQELAKLRRDNDIFQWLFRLSEVLLFLEDPSELWTQFRDLFIQLMNLIGGCFFRVEDGVTIYSECFGRIPFSDEFMLAIREDVLGEEGDAVRVRPLFIEHEGRRYPMIRYNLSLENKNGEVVYLIQADEDDSQKLMRFLLDYYGMAIQLISQRKKLRDQLDLDPLTGIWNRRALESNMEEYFLRNSGQPAVFVLFDLDYFKRLNDTLGHLMGDEALKAVAVHIRGSLRKGDWVARLGGDEFVMVLQNTRWGGRWVKQMRRMLSFSPLEKYSLGVTAGIVEIPREAFSYQEAYRLADQRLYHGKKKGKNIVVYQPDQAEWKL